MEGIYSTGWFAFQFGVPVVGLVLLTIGEIILLKKTMWLETTKVISFSLVNAACSFAFGFVLMVVNMIMALLISLPVGMIFAVLFGWIDPNLAVVFYFVFLFFVLFVSNWIVFFLIRLLTKKLMVKSSGLTWKYHLILAMVPAAVIACVYPMMTGIAALYAYFNPSI